MLIAYLKKLLSENNIEVSVIRKEVDSGNMNKKDLLKHNILNTSRCKEIVFIFLLTY